MPEPFDVGNETECFIIDQNARPNRNARVVSDILSEVNNRMPNNGLMVKEYYGSTQVEDNSPVFSNWQDLDQYHRRKRSLLARVAGKKGLLTVYAGMLPGCSCQGLRPTAKKRYTEIREKIPGAREALRKSMGCAFQSHVTLNNPDLRVEISSRLHEFLFLFLKLGESSFDPDSGEMAHRLRFWEALPNTGLPSRLLTSWDEYRQYVLEKINEGSALDMSTMWWHVRPHHRFDTIEMRIGCSPTYVEDCAPLTALLAVLKDYLLDRRDHLEMPDMALVQYNIEQAIRQDAEVLKVRDSSGKDILFRTYLERLIRELQPYADALGCGTMIGNLDDIFQRGTSSQHQKRIWEEAMARKATKEEAYQEIMHYLAETSLNGVPGANRIRQKINQRFK